MIVLSKTQPATSSPKLYSREGANQLLAFSRCFGGERGHWISHQHLQEANVYWLIHLWKSFSPQARKINLIKTLVHRALMICSKTKLDSELDTITQLVSDNGYPEDVLVLSIKEKLANISSEKQFGPEKCPVYLQLSWLGNVSSKVENQLNKAITSCFYDVKPHAVYNTRVMLPSAKKDSSPTTQKMCVVYDFFVPM